mmetsp:Transcript_17505/g.35988  ORF Transcript_17505/g.35988 Transcript_17505/m.35988 type:complete len:471 (+) Transcript_17505:492-1904(+)|eukprot:CAMPEP_0201117838 /NCGR_PEP_ID=MMETSP0850-20130426/1875_1 /ASSEMBLY_ACC=CAM_ASM_000622 /TAXON_ID=183588 /ORGANISM="Pseudo-nitzschia fraudulenta, Strain WWA7" /LENGTH=470 /DNA_ID=CAMNT_0047382509 /DNA_START=584 /DNA_END=1996 /DNA_ORIENTATION=-
MPCKSQCSVACRSKKNQAVAAQPQPARSFYQRKLPDTCVAFASREGKKIFRSALENDGLKSFYNLIEQHHTQTEPAFCGVSTLVMVLNALAVDPGQNWKGPWRWYEEKMLNCCVDMEEIKQSGITLKDFKCLAFCQGLTASLQYCDSTSSLENFRKTVERACVEEPQTDGDDDETDDGKELLECLVVSYSRRVLHQTGDGHFSPIAAYDEASDSVLILDTARFKYGAHWTKLPLVYEAMKPVDSDTGKSRGYVLLSFVPQTKNDASGAEGTTPATNPESTGSPNNAAIPIDARKLSTQPASILFRSRMNQMGHRRLYKEYIRSMREKTHEQGEIPYDTVRSYWSEGGGDRSTSVWEIIVPTMVNGEEAQDLFCNMRMLLSDLKSRTAALGGESKEDMGSSNGNPASDKSWYASAEETLYIIYLATLSEKQRYDYVMNFESEAPSVVRTQIVKEADMIASAIEVSDQLISL